MKEDNEGKQYPTALQAELHDINNKIETMTRITEESIQILEEKKRQIRKEADPNAADAESGLKFSANDLDSVIGELDREISRIQAEHDSTVVELKQQKNWLQKRQSSIERLDLLTSVLTYKIFETQYEYRKEMEEKLRQKEELMQQSDMSDNQRAVNAAELDKLIADYKNTHESAIASLDGQRLELQREIATKIENNDLMLHILNKQHEAIIADLETKRVEASPSFDEEMARRILELEKMFERDVNNLKHIQSQNSKEESEIPEASNMFHDLEKTSGSTSSLSEDTSTETTESGMTSEDVEYLKIALGTPLTLALAEITTKQPRDPIHYLAHWLFKYRYNQEIDLNRKQEIQELVAEREKLENEKLRARYEEEAREAVTNMVIREEEEAIRRELERIARESGMYQDEEDDSEARDVLGVYDGPPAGQRI